MVQLNFLCANFIACVVNLIRQYVFEEYFNNALTLFLKKRKEIVSIRPCTKQVQAYHLFQLNSTIKIFVFFFFPP